MEDYFPFGKAYFSGSMLNFQNFRHHHHPQLTNLNPMGHVWIACPRSPHTIHMQGWNFFHLQAGEFPRKNLEKKLPRNINQPVKSKGKQSLKWVWVVSFEYSNLQIMRLLMEEIWVKHLRCIRPNKDYSLINYQQSRVGQISFIKKYGIWPAPRWSSCVCQLLMEWKSLSFTKGTRIQETNRIKGVCMNYT